VSDPAQVDSLLAECGRRYGALDVVVNNAGVISHEPFERLAVAEWHRVLDTSLTAAYLVVQKALPWLRSGASVVNVGPGSHRGNSACGPLHRREAGLIGLTRSRRKELGPRGIRVNLVAPGVIDTGAELSAEARARYEGMTALRRLGDPADVAAVVCFLASDLAGYLTGATIQVDGGV